jgi:hypothetical protein
MKCGLIQDQIILYNFAKLTLSGNVFQETKSSGFIQTKQSTIHDGPTAHASGSKIQRNSLCSRCWNFTLLEYFLQGNMECKKTIFTIWNWIMMSLIQSLHTSTMWNWINDTTDPVTAYTQTQHEIDSMTPLTQSLYTHNHRMNLNHDTTDTFTAHRTPYHVLQIFFQLNLLYSVNNSSTIHTKQTIG